MRNFLKNNSVVQYFYSKSIVREFYTFIKGPFFHIVRILPIYLIRGGSALVPKRKNLWLFGSLTGFSDNTRVLFLYILKECKNIDAIWISKDQQVVQNLKNQQLPVHYTYSLQGILSCLRAQVIFTTHGKDDINPIITGGSIHVELLHCVITPKRGRYHLPQHYSLLQKLLLILKVPFYYFKPDYGISSSPFITPTVMDNLSQSEDRVFLTGCPRTDEMLRNTDEDRKNIQTILGDQKYTHLIYYTPTFRNSPDFDFLSFDLDQEELGKFLNKTNSIFIIRFHPIDMKRGRTLANFHPRIIVEDHKIYDPFSLLKKATVLITDYSSTFIDYLLLDRPIIFANFDHQNYYKAGYLQDEKYFTYEELTPGPKAENWKIVLSYLEDILIHQKDHYQEARKMVLAKLYQFTDGQACARIVNKMSQVINLQIEEI